MSMLLVVINNTGFFVKKKNAIFLYKNLKSGTDRVYDAFLKLKIKAIINLLLIYREYTFFKLFSFKKVV